MSEAKLPPQPPSSEAPSAVRFCPSCGQATAPGANFCIACGASLRRIAAAASAPAAAAGHANAPHRSDLPGLIVLSAFLALGLTLWFLVLQPASAPARLPLAPKEPASSAPETAAATMPPDHPPVQMPDEVKKYLGDLEAQAAAAPKDAQVWKNLAQVQYRAGQIDGIYLAKAEASYRHLLELDAKSLDAIRGLGNVHFDREEYAKAIERYTQYLDAKPDDVSVRTDLGTMYLYSHQADRAIAEYEKALGVDPRFYQAYFNLGIAHREKGDTAKSIAVLEKAKELAPDERTKSQIQTAIDQASGRTPAVQSAAGAGSFQERVERSLRGHEIVGPKIARFEWSSKTDGRLVLDSFPMDQMPEAIRTRFVDRLASELAATAQAAGETGTPKLELVDSASGRVMATVTAKAGVAANSTPAVPPAR
jgi:tetratricopeptide (TPR) repeat protein